MTAPARPSPETIPMLDLRAQYESIAPEIRAAIDEVLAAQQFVLGPRCEAFEHEVAQACGTRYGVGVASGTEALELALHACGVSDGDEVIVPAFTFIATGSAVTSLGRAQYSPTSNPPRSTSIRHSWNCVLHRERAPSSSCICSVSPRIWIRFLRWLQSVTFLSSRTMRNPSERAITDGRQARWDEPAA